MNQTQVHLRYGKTNLPLRVPTGTTILRGQEIPAVPDPAAAIRQALQNPIGTAPLPQLLAAKKPRTVAITISDITRPVPNQLFLPVLLDMLSAAGVRDQDVTIVIATGMHRPSTPAERQILVGDALLKRVDVIDHVADAKDTLVRISDNPPVSVNARFAKADFRIVTGLIEPHFMAGYSGGRKGVCPGLVDLTTVQRFHGYRILSDPRSENGVLEGNPCHAESLRIAKLVGVDFLLNVAITHDRKLAGVYVGDMEAAHAAGVRDVAGWTSCKVDRPYDLVVTCAGGYPLDETFYQTSKGICGALPALHEKSTLLTLSACTEVGSPEYVETMARWHHDWQGFLAHIQACPKVTKDQWQYQMMARVLAKIGVDRTKILGDGLPAEVFAKLAVCPVNGSGDAATRTQRFVDEFVAAHPQARIAVVPEGPYTMLVN